MQSVLPIPAKAPNDVRLTRAEFKALARDKGWRFTTLAQRWGVTPAWISMVCRDEQRDLRYDDALLGLPDLRDALRDQTRRRRRIEQAMAHEGARQTQAEPGAAGKRRPAGYRYRGYMTLGSIVTVSSAFGSLADEGERGIVFQITVRGKEECYRVLFEDGIHDWFTPQMVDDYLVTSGLLSPIAGDTGQDAERLASMQQAWQAGQLVFRPEPAAMTMNAGNPLVPITRLA